MRRHAYIVVLGIAASAAACSRGAASTGLSELEHDTGVRWTAETDPRFGTTAYLFPSSPPPVVLSEDGSPSAAAMALLSSYSSVFSLTDPSHELVAEDEGRPDGLAFASFTEVLGGVPVYGTRLTVVFDRDGRVAFVVSAALASTAAVTSSPALSPSQAAALAEKDLLGRYPGASKQAIASSPSLVLYPLSSTPRLAYVTSVSLEGASVPTSYVVDASSGEVLDAASELRFMDAGSGLAVVPASGTGELGGTHYFSASVPMEPNGSHAPYTMQARATALVSAISVRSFVLGNAFVSSDVLTSWDTVGENPGSAVDAYVNLGIADHWWHEHGRKSYDDDGGSVAILVHDNELLHVAPGEVVPCVDNAFWSAARFHVCPSNGIAPSIAVHAVSVDLTVMAHEYQHAVTGSALGLQGPGEAGALDESISDVFGQLIAHDEDVEEAHCIAAATWLPAGPERPRAGLRNLVDPHQSARAQPDNVRDPLYACPSGGDNGCVHLRDGVPNKAWSLMTFGGEDHTGSNFRVSPSLAMGWEASESLYINLIQAKPVPPISTFHSLGYALDGLARARFGRHSSQREAAACAFYAVGVYASHEMTVLGVDPCKCGNPSATCDAGSPDAAPDAPDAIARGAGLRCVATVDAGVVQCASYYFPYATTAPSCADFTSGVISSNVEVAECPYETSIYGCCTFRHGAEMSQACYYEDTVDAGPVFKALCEEGMGSWGLTVTGIPQAGGGNPSQDAGTETDAGVDATSDASPDAEPAHC